MLRHGRSWKSCRPPIQSFIRPRATCSTLAASRNRGRMARRRPNTARSFTTIRARKRAAATECSCSGLARARRPGGFSERSANSSNTVHAISASCSENGMISRDGRSANSSRVNSARICPFCYPCPYSPPLAARFTITLKALAARAGSGPRQQCRPGTARPKEKLPREGVFPEMNRRRNYEKPCERRAREEAEAVRRCRKLLRKRLEREGY